MPEQRQTGPGPGVSSAWLTPVLMVYYLCCWPHDDNSDTSSERRGRGGRRGMLGHHEGGSHRELFSRRMASSAVSLHLPSTSGEKEALSAHRSHEEIGRRKSHHEPRHEARYHSAPSVIDEVLHRRDWERSTRELHIPLRGECEVLSTSSGSPEPAERARAPCAEPESSSLEDHRSDEQIVSRVCKKHHTNIKSSKGKKERQVDDDKDSDATEANFYIGDNDLSAKALGSQPERDESAGHTDERPSDAAQDARNEDIHHSRQSSVYRAKEAKQSFNESIRSKAPRQVLVPLDELQPRVFEFCLDDVIEQLESLDRSGATHHSIESRVSLSRPPYPPPSVEAVGYEGGAVYLAERARGEGCPPPRAPAAPPALPLRARHASDGDILAPPHRPESGAFSESDLDLECEDEPPPPYDQLRRPPSDTRRPPSDTRRPPSDTRRPSAHTHIETAI